MSKLAHSSPFMDEIEEDDDYANEPYDSSVDCWHEDSEIDILTGRADCWSCGATWWASDEEIRMQAEHMQRYAEWEAEQQRPWSRFREWCRRKWPNRLRYQNVVPNDDDIPF